MELLKEPKMWRKFEREILDPLGPQVGLNDQGTIDTMYVSFLDEEKKNDFRYGEPVAPESALEEASKGLYPEGFWSGQSDFGAGTVDGINLPRLDPEHYKDEFEKRSELYEGFDEDPEIKEKTDFFGAASDVTNDISWGTGASGYGILPLTMGPIDYYNHDGMYSKHMENISADLEIMNRENARRIEEGLPVEGIDNNLPRGAFNRRMVEVEQGEQGVQGYLDQMDPEERETFVRLNNDIMHSWFTEKGNELLSNGNLSEFNNEFEKGMGRKFNFGNQSDRVALGRFTANKNSKK